MRRLPFRLSQSLERSHTDEHCPWTCPHTVAWELHPEVQEAAIAGRVEQWNEQQLLEMAISLRALRTIKHQPRNLKLRTCMILKTSAPHAHPPPMCQEA